MRRSTWIVLALAAVVAVAAIFAISANTSSSGLVDSAKFAELQKQGVRVIDVRTAAEFENGHIPGAENVPLSAFADSLGDWDPSEPIALYCATGSRSAEAAQMLKAAGFEKVYDLSGGIAAWQGQVDGAPATAGSGTSEPTAVPVMYEFFTDW